MADLMFSLTLTTNLRRLVVMGMDEEGLYSVVVVVVVVVVVDRGFLTHSNMHRL